MTRLLCRLGIHDFEDTRWLRWFVERHCRRCGKRGWMPSEQEPFPTFVFQDECGGGAHVFPADPGECKCRLRFRIGDVEMSNAFREYPNLAGSEPRAGSEETPTPRQGSSEIDAPNEMCESLREEYQALRDAVDDLISHYRAEPYSEYRIRFWESFDRLREIDSNPASASEPVEATQGPSTDGNPRSHPGSETPDPASEPKEET